MCLLLIVGCGAGAPPARSASPARSAFPAGAQRAAGKAAYLFVSGRDSPDRWSDPQLFVADASGANARNLTNNAFSNESPTLSPDGRHVAFISSRRRPGQIYVIDIDGGEARRLSGSIEGAASPRWSPRGEIAFAAPANAPHTAIWIVDADGGDERRLTTPGPNEADDGGLAFVDEGRTLVFSRYNRTTQDRDLYAVAVDHPGPPTRLTQTPHTSETEPVASHDGRLLAYRAVPMTGDMHESIVLVNVDTWRRVRDLPLPAPASGNISGIDFTGDDRGLVFGADASDVGGSLQNLQGEIFTMDLEGRHLTRITRNAAFDGSPVSLPGSLAPRGSSSSPAVASAPPPTPPEDVPLRFSSHRVRLFGYGAAFRHLPGGRRAAYASTSAGSDKSTIFPRGPNDPAPGASIPLVEITCTDDETTKPPRVSCVDGGRAPWVAPGEHAIWSASTPGPWVSRLRACFAVSSRPSSAQQRSRARKMAAAGAATDVPASPGDGFVLVRVFHRKLVPELKPAGCGPGSPSPCDPVGVPTGRMVPVLYASWEVQDGDQPLEREAAFPEGHITAHFVVPYHAQIPPAPPEEPRFAWLVHQWVSPRPATRAWWQNVDAWLARFSPRRHETDVTLAIDLDRVVAALAVHDTMRARSAIAALHRDNAAAGADRTSLAGWNRITEVRDLIAAVDPALRGFAAGRWTLDDPCAP